MFVLLFFYYNVEFWIIYASLFEIRKFLDLLMLSWIVEKKTFSYLISPIREKLKGAYIEMQCISNIPKTYERVFIYARLTRFGIFLSYFIKSSSALFVYKLDTEAEK